MPVGVLKAGSSLSAIFWALFLNICTQYYSIHSISIVAHMEFSTFYTQPSHIQATTVLVPTFFLSLPCLKKGQSLTLACLDMASVTIH